MEYYHHGIIRIPLSIIGLLVNTLALYCLVKKNKGRQISNPDRLLVALNLWDAFTCFVIMPFKAIVYIGFTPDEKPLSIRYTDIVNNWVSNFLIILIALDRYLKISKPLRYHALMTSRRINVSLVGSLLISLIVSSVIFINMV
eukprot:TCONS_00003838-protein